MLLADAAADRGIPLPPLLRTADRLRLALPPVPVSPRFEARLGSRLAMEPRRRLLAANPLQVRVPAWLVFTGVASSAALGVGVTAFALWRSGRHTGRPSRS